MNVKVHHAVHHTTDFLVLFLLLSAGLGTLLYFQYNFVAQITTAIVMCFAYALWGIFHHFHEGNLNWEVVIEYVSISSLVGFILAIFLLRA